MDMLLFWLSQPSNFLLIALLAGVGYMLWMAQSNPDNGIDFADIFRDSVTRKITWDRFAAIGAFIASTWVVVALASLQILSEAMFVVYLGVWSGSAVAMRLINVWKPSLQPAQPPAAPPADPVEPAREVEPKPRPRRGENHD